MHAAAFRLSAAALLTVACVALGSTGAPARPRAAQPPQAAASNGPPHAWLFGTWTGGLFPVLNGMVAQDCRTQPTVVFGRDGVSHATLLGTTLVPRSISTVRATATGAEFQFEPATDPGASFGCENRDTLHVTRSHPNEISFPNCNTFPYPLQRCAG